jgi:hypothetical protein
MPNKPQKLRKHMRLSPIKCYVINTVSQVGWWIIIVCGDILGGVGFHTNLNFAAVGGNAYVRLEINAKLITHKGDTII